MIIERVKYIIWAKDTPRAIAFYRDTLGGRVIRQTEHIAEIARAVAGVAPRVVPVLHPAVAAAAPTYRKYVMRFSWA